MEQTMIKNIKWTLSNGKLATYTIQLLLAEELDADGYKITVPCCKIDTDMSIEDMGYISSTIQQQDGKIGDIPVVAVIGGKVGIRFEIYAQIQAAMAEIKTHPAWIAKEEKEKKEEKEAKERYANMIKSGMCPKCGTWCYGDCAAT